jgi:hypothetical protein
MLNLLYSFLKFLSFAIIALVIGAIAADELANRMERRCVLLAMRIAQPPCQKSQILCKTL